MISEDTSVPRRNAGRRKRWLIVALIGTSGVLGLLGFAWATHVGIRPTERINGIPFSEIVGEYYFGDGLSNNYRLAITKSGRFALRETGRHGWHAESVGSLVAREDHLVLQPVWPLWKTFGGTPNSFLPVRWEGRMYLIPKDDLDFLCEMIANWVEPRFELRGPFYLRVRDLYKPTQGDPELSEEWAERLRKERARDEAYGISVKRVVPSPDGKLTAILRGNDVGWSNFDGLRVRIQDAAGRIVHNGRCSELLRTREENVIWQSDNELEVSDGLWTYRLNRQADGHWEGRFER